MELSDQAKEIQGHIDSSILRECTFSYSHDNDPDLLRASQELLQCIHYPINIRYSPLQLEPGDLSGLHADLTLRPTQSTVHIQDRSEKGRDSRDKDEKAVVRA